MARPNIFRGKSLHRSAGRTTKILDLDFSSCTMVRSCGTIIGKRTISCLHSSASRNISSNRNSLLEAARGFFLSQPCKSDQGRRVLRCFPIISSNVRRPLKTPIDFHSTLCQLIASAKKRVYLTSLYIGPAANPLSVTKERELLDALQATRAPDVKVLLDRNRALRPVPVIQHENLLTADVNSGATISSAEACFQCIKQKLLNQNDPSVSSSLDTGVFLLSVLPFWQQILLRNPYNEVAGVFHLKCYIMDDNIIFTGANLSEEYFVDRVDRYLWLSDGIHQNHITSDGSEVAPLHALLGDHTTSLVEHYAMLIEVLCRHAQPFTSSSDICSQYLPRTSTHKLVQELRDLLTVDACTEVKKVLWEENHEASAISNDTDVSSTMSYSKPNQSVVAYAVPTFQAPAGFARGLHSFVPKDTDIVASLIKTASGHASVNRKFLHIRIASAYLNLTDEMINTLSQCKNAVIHLMTAGFISHGFKPNPKKVGNKGKAWIPAVFDVLSRQCVESLQSKSADSFFSEKLSTYLWYYRRVGWTYHAKGIWLTESATHENRNIADASCIATTHGSGNYGGRSAHCDLESNLILIHSDTPSETSQRFRTMVQGDWNDMCDHVVPDKDENVQRLSIALRISLPFIRNFF